MLQHSILGSKAAEEPFQSGSFCMYTANEEDAAMLAKLKDLVERSPVQATKILNSASKRCPCGQHEKSKQENRALYQWLLKYTSHLGSKYSTQQRIHWALNQLEDFPKCIVCGKPIDDPKQFKTIHAGYRPFCSSKCAKAHGSQVSKEVRLKKNNGKYFSDESLQKSKQTFMANYGVDNNMKSEKGKREHREAIEKKYGKGITNVWQVEEKKQKIKKTKLDRHGDESWNNPEKAKKTLSSKPKELRDATIAKRKETCMRNNGVDVPAKSSSILKKILSNRRNGCYAVDGHSFDSLPEFCFYVCCKHFGIDILCHPIEMAIQYIDNSGKQHHYYPDFYLPKANCILEIKGDHFFKDKDPKKGLVCRFGEDGNGATESKWRAMVEHNVLVLTSKRYTHYVKWVKRHYGTKWIRQHKVPCKHNNA